MIGDKEQFFFKRKEQRQADEASQRPTWFGRNENPIYLKNTKRTKPQKRKKK